MTSKIFTEAQLNEEEPLFEDYPYQVWLVEDQGEKKYAVVNVETEVCEAVEVMLGKALTYADHGAGFLQMFFEIEDESPKIDIFGADAIPKAQH